MLGDLVEMTNTFKLVTPVFCAAFLAGCSSLNYHAEHRPPRIYPGVHEDFVGIAKTNEAAPFGAVAVGYAVVDMPFSFVVDTLYLPADIIAVARYKPSDQYSTSGTNNIAH